MKPRFLNDKYTFFLNQLTTSTLHHVVENSHYFYVSFYFLINKKNIHLMNIISLFFLMSTNHFASCHPYIKSSIIYLLFGIDSFNWPSTHVYYVLGLIPMFSH